MKFVHHYMQLIAMSEFSNNPDKGDNRLRPQDIDVSQKPLIIPKGCKEYYFDECGEFCCGDEVTYIWKNLSVFYCIASSDRVAKEKFNKKWLSKNKK